MLYAGRLSALQKAERKVRLQFQKIRNRLKTPPPGIRAGFALTESRYFRKNPLKICETCVDSLNYLCYHN